VASGEDPL